MKFKLLLLTILCASQLMMKADYSDFFKTLSDAASKKIQDAIAQQAQKATDTFGDKLSQASDSLLKTVQDKIFSTQTTDSKNITASDEVTQLFTILEQKLDSQKDSISTMDIAALIHNLNANLLGQQNFIRFNSNVTEELYQAINEQYKKLVKDSIFAQAQPKLQELQNNPMVKQIVQDLITLLFKHNLNRENSSNSSQFNEVEPLLTPAALNAVTQ